MDREATHRLLSLANGTDHSPHPPRQSAKHDLIPYSIDSTLSPAASAPQPCLCRQGPSLGSNLEMKRKRWDSRLTAKGGQERQEAATHGGTFDLYSCPALPPSKVRARLLPKAETPVPTPDSSCEPEIYKVLVCDMGKAKGTKSPIPGPMQGRRGPAQEGQGLPAWFPEAGRKGQPAPTRGWENSCSPGQERTRKETGSVESYEGGRGRVGGWCVMCTPGGEGRNWRDLGKLREWDSPSGAYSCGPAGQPEWPSQIPPAPLPWSWLSTQGSQRH